MQNINQRIGICGGGQLGKMLLQAASPMALDISVLDKDPSFPAGAYTSQFYVGDFTDYDHVVAFGEDKDIITIEIESVNLEALKTLEASGKKVYPQPRALEIIRDKGLQKQFYKQNSLPSSDYFLVENIEEIHKRLADGTLKFPFVQKSRRDGYDGKGVLIVKSTDDLQHLFTNPSLIEECVDIDKELSVIVARNASGEIKTFPLVEMEFHPVANLVSFLFSPSSVSQAVAKDAEALAKSCAEKLGIVGLLAVELFLDRAGNILINEVAPRPHNSGHHTIECCVTSQYSQMLRAIMDLPLGDTSQPRAGVMVNLIGEPDYQGLPYYQGLEEVLSWSGVFPHLYGKKVTKPYRKMGHVTITHSDIKEAIKLANKVKSILKVISQ